MIIGLTGKMGAGKQEVADYLKNKGYAYFRYSDVLREEAKKRGMPETRENLQKLGNLLREEHKDEGILSSKLLAMVKGRAVVDGIRNVSEIEGMRKAEKFVLFAVVANDKLRFERLQSRGRDGDPLTFAEFKTLDTYENTGKGTQHIDACIAAADHVIENESSLVALHKKIDEVLSNL